MFVTLLPTLMLNSNSQSIPLSLRDYCGWGLWVIGFSIEVIADFQKATFRNDPRNKVSTVSY